MRTVLLPLVLAASSLAAFGADNSIGTWKLNTERSKHTPGMLPIKTLTITREASDGGVKVTVSGERTEGTAINANYTAKYDGKDVQVTGSNLLFDKVSVKQDNANTFTESRSKTDGKYRATGHTVISDDGKTMTSTTKGTGADGKKFTQTLVFDKQ